MRRLTGWLLTAALLAAPLAAGELADVQMPDRTEVAGEELVLNGMGLRKKLFIKVYVGGLYLPAAESDPAAILAADAPRHMVMHFLYKKVGEDDLCEAWNDGLENNTAEPSDAVRSQFSTLCDWMEEVRSGEEMAFTYVPGTGTTVEVKGEEKGVLPGKAFADALFACWIGPEPPSKDLREGLLGS